LKRTDWFLLAAALALLAPLAQAQTDPQPADPLPVPPQATSPVMAPSAGPLSSGKKPQRLGTDKFDAVDSNHDGSISREEAAAAPRLSEKFSEIDADKDGRIGQSELKAYAKTHRGKKADKQGGKQFQEMDSNHDGVISREESAQNKKLAKRFDAADTNRDGSVSPEEAAAAKGK
jgi:Ca2+-binding EF-hand superfamily protein